MNAAFSYASAVPFVGWYSTGAKWAKRTITLANGSRHTLKWLVNSNDVIQFGRRSNLRKIIGLTDTNFQAHHIIPWNKGTSDIVQNVAKADNPFHMNEALNGIPIESWRNQPNHHTYDQNVQNLLDSISPDLNPNETAEDLQNIITIIRGVIENNPTLDLDDLIF